MFDAVILPPLMGMFCTGYVLHRAWHWRKMRQPRKHLRDLEKMMERIHFVDWQPEEHSEVRRAA